MLLVRPGTGPRHGRGAPQQELQEAAARGDLVAGAKWLGLHPSEGRMQLDDMLVPSQSVLLEAMTCW